MNVHEAIKNRRSIRKYDSRQIDAPTLDKLREALRLAPSACNFQPWRFILVQNELLRSDLAKACCNQNWMAQAPLIVVGCGLPQNAYKTMASHYNSIEVDLAIALDHLSLAATAEALGTCWIGAFDETAVKKLLTIPDDHRVIAIMTVGHPKSPDLISPNNPPKRKQNDEIFTIRQ